MCEDDTFLVAIKVMKPFADVAPCLGVTRQKVAAIKRKRVSEETKSLDMLRYWKNERGSGATHLALVEGLLEAEDHVAAEAVAAHVRDISKPMATEGYSVSPENDIADDVITRYCTSTADSSGMCPCSDVCCC